MVQRRVGVFPLWWLGWLKDGYDMVGRGPLPGSWSDRPWTTSRSCRQRMWSAPRSKWKLRCGKMIPRCISGEVTQELWYHTKATKDHIIYIYIQYILIHSNLENVQELGLPKPYRLHRHPLTSLIWQALIYMKSIRSTGGWHTWCPHKCPHRSPGWYPEKLVNGWWFP